MQKNNDSKKIINFWNWFSENIISLVNDFENEEFLGLLDEQIVELGNFAWEVGLGKLKSNQLVISPGGDEDLLKDTKLIVSLAPKIQDWEFHYAKQVKEWNYNFKYESENGNDIQIDASKWKYLLLKYKDGKYGAIFQTINSTYEFSDDDKIYIAQILLDSCIGEELRILYFDDFDLVQKLDSDYVGKEREIESLHEVFNKLIQ